MDKTVKLILNQTDAERLLDGLQVLAIPGQNDQITIKDIDDFKHLLVKIQKQLLPQFESIRHYETTLNIH